MIANLKFYSIVALIIGALGVLAYGARLKSKADRMEEAERNLVQYHNEVAERDAQMALEKAADEKRREALAITLENVSGQLADLRSKPIKPVNRDQIVNGCPDPRISADFASVWNQQADIASKAAMPAPN